ncbi:MAG TPA: hypothetical protein VGB49_07970 [Caulobacteraceae bacterium]
MAATPSPPGATHSQRPDNREVEYEDQRRPAAEGRPPRSAYEPKGSENTSNSGETETDPATGEPNRQA